MKKTVLIYRHSLLPPSETFIKLQASLIKEWNAILFGIEKNNPSLDLNGMPYHIYTQSGKATIIARAARKLIRLFWKNWIDQSLVEQARVFNPQIVHAHFATDALEAYKLAKALKVKLIITIHGYDVSIYPEVWASGKMGKGMRNYSKRLAKIAKDPDVSFIAVSNAIKSIAISQFEIPADKVKVIYLGINPDEFHPSSIPISLRPLKIIYVGRMVEKKGPAVLIKAFAAVKKKIPQAKLVMIGAGPLLEDMKRLAQNLNINVDFMGVQPSSIVKSELENSRIFCLPSIRAQNGDSEAMGIALLEAQAMEVPVVTSAIGGKDEGIIDGVTGLSFNEGDTETLAKILGEYLSNDEKLMNLAKAGPVFIRDKHNAIKQTRELMNYYNGFFI